MHRQVSNNDILPNTWPAHVREPDYCNLDSYDALHHHGSESGMESTFTDAYLTLAIRPLQESGNRARWCCRCSRNLGHSWVRSCGNRCWQVPRTFLSLTFAHKTMYRFHCCRNSKWNRFFHYQITIQELMEEFDRKCCGWDSLRRSAVCRNCATRHWFGRWGYWCRGNCRHVRGQIFPSALSLFISLTSRVD